jgi:hypothetical protein
VRNDQDLATEAEAPDKGNPCGCRQGADQARMICCRARLTSAPETITFRSGTAVFN